jgi:hypothetical protein
MAEGIAHGVTEATAIRFCTVGPAVLACVLKLVQRCLRACKSWRPQIKSAGDLSIKYADAAATAVADDNDENGDAYDAHDANDENG